jgi:membrane fusion protein (multidrug efflux system)
MRVGWEQKIGLPMTKSKLLGAVVLVAAGIAAWSFYGSSAKQAPDQAKGKKGSAVVQVVAVPVRFAEVQQTYQALGTANANEAITITSKLTGTVRSINFTEGQLVPKGHILVELDDREAKATLASSVADEATAKANYQRAAQLLTSGNSPKATVETLRTTWEGAQARAEAARARLADLTIRAPFAGRLGLRRLSVGALVSSGTLITTLDDVSVVKLDFSVPEILLSRVAAGAEVVARSDAYPARIFKGIAKTVDSRIDPVTRAVEVRAELPNTDGTLHQGMLLTVTLVLDKRDAAMVIPEEALVPIGDEQFVYVLEDGKAVQKKIVLGERLRGSVEVRDGLAKDAKVVVGGQQRLRNGIAVRELQGVLPMQGS